MRLAKSVMLHTDPPIKSFQVTEDIVIPKLVLNSFNVPFIITFYFSHLSFKTTFDILSIVQEKITINKLSL